VLFDLPTGATIVYTFGAVLILMFLVHMLFFHRRNAPALVPASSAENARESVHQ
jgi:hypothetical protein